MFVMRSKVWLLAVLLVACGEPAAVETTTISTTTAVAVSTTAAAEGPTAIVSLSPTATEMLAAIGALSQVVAVDDQSDFPPEVPVTDLSGFTPNIEAIASYEPDLVVVAADPDGMVGALESLDIPVLLLPPANSFDDVYSQIEQLGSATGHLAESEELVGNMRAEIDELVSGYQPPAEPTTFYHELDPGLFSITSATFIGSVYSLFGLENIADAADPDGSGYPQLSAEYIISSDPDFIFLADTGPGGQTAEVVAGRPGWSVLTAVTSGRVVELNDDVASRWGPRVVEFVRAVADALALRPVG
jgi:iron complex transport system substrate-binding protein